MSEMNAIEQIPDLRFEIVFTKAFNQSSGGVFGILRMLLVDQVGVVVVVAVAVAIAILITISTATATAVFPLSPLTHPPIHR